MSLEAPDLLSQNLRESNSRLSFWLDSLASPGETAPRCISPEQMGGLLSELMRAGEWLRNLPSKKGMALESDLREYRKTVERLRELLPSIQYALLEERARLEQERARVQVAADWARRSQQTL